MEVGNWPLHAAKERASVPLLSRPVCGSPFLHFTRTLSRTSVGQTATCAVKLRVERQTHLPADRTEAWRALESLVDQKKWSQRASVFAALEAIYSAECQQQAARLQKAFRTANETLEEIQLAEKLPNELQKDQETAERLQQPARNAYANSTGAAGTSAKPNSGHDDSEGDGKSYEKCSARDNHASTSQHGETDEPETSEEKGPGKAALAVVAKATSEKVTSVSKSANEGNGSSHDSDDDSIDEAEVLTLQSVDFESASRMEYDRERRKRIDRSNMLHSTKADQEFVLALFTLLRKAHFVHLSARDEALARSLNADYVAQLFISPDTRQLDTDLFDGSLEQLDVPEQAQSMLVFKRGYGQARRKGRMLVAKLDYLQYTVVTSFLGFIAAQSKRYWRAFRPHRESERTNSHGVSESSDTGLWTILQQASQRAAKQLKRSGLLSPRFLLTGGGLFMTLSNWGLLPQVDVEPLGRFRDAWKPNEPQRLAPVHVERVSLRDAVSAHSGISLENMIGKIELIEPTFQELLVVYRRAPADGWLDPIRRSIFGFSEEEQAPRYRRRNAINMRIYRDVPMPTWKIVFPDKLLQFRPLDGLRADLLTVAGLVAFIAQAKYDSIILELITLSSAIVLLVRVVLGYKRMNDRFDKMANEMLAETTVAGQEGVIEYIAGSAALQQFEQTSLAYLVLLQSDQPLDAEGLCLAVETMLEKEFRVRIRFDANEALEELKRLGLAQESSQGCTACEPAEGLSKLNEHWTGLLLRQA